MEYFCSENLEDLNNMRDFCKKKEINLLYQAFDALKYLDVRGIAYHDLKPSNILIESWILLFIKLTNFGLANNNPNMKTLCGTYLFLTPKIYLEMRYTIVVDLWSLKVIILEYVHGLLSTKLQISQENLKHRDLPSVAVSLSMLMIEIQILW